MCASARRASHADMMTVAANSTMELQPPIYIYHSPTSPHLGSSAKHTLVDIFQTRSVRESKMPTAMNRIEEPLMLSMDPQGISRQQLAPENGPVDPITPSFDREKSSKRDCVDQPVSFEAIEDVCHLSEAAAINFATEPMRSRPRNYQDVAPAAPNQVPLTPQIPPQTPTFATKTKRNNMRKEISASASSRYLMRQVSGLGMEDPVFGESEKEKLHPSQIFDDMSVNDIPEDMRDMISVASDPTATHDSTGFDTRAFSNELSNFDEFGFVHIPVPSCTASHNSVSSSTAPSSSATSPSPFKTALHKKITGSNSSVGWVSDHTRSSKNSFGPKFSSGNLQSWDKGESTSGSALALDIISEEHKKEIPLSQQRQPEHGPEIGPLSTRGTAAAAADQEITFSSSTAEQEIALSSSFSSPSVEDAHHDIEFNSNSNNKTLDQEINFSSTSAEHEVRLPASSAQGETISKEEKMNRVFEPKVMQGGISVTASSRNNTDLSLENLRLSSSTSDDSSHKIPSCTPDTSSSSRKGIKKNKSSRRRVVSAAQRAMPALRGIFPEAARTPVVSNESRQKSNKRTKSRIRL